MSRRVRSYPLQSAPEVTPIVQLYLLRMLVPLGGQTNFISRNGFSCDRIAEAIGLGHMVDSESEEFKPAVAKTNLRRLHLQIEAKVALQPEAFEPEQLLRANIQSLTQLVGLNDCEQRILTFTSLLHSNRMLDDAADMIGPLTSIKAIQSLSDLLSIPGRAHSQSTGSPRDPHAFRTGFAGSTQHLPAQSQA
jgi:transitional endoplasmic reticulum ATPase